ncbi:hypothetical protein OUZ56_007707 [Daphnia magna]|uniref:Uncharacterized protein n=1 Tax=Daphnia magna TaxID=35525 RepID=A0ABR0AAQ8_9CRUS|nr:hypothetical protein OUZ56_007706 [Daphnia magna]KAK4022228.1 hypothetical protein OUZ56_007707 [Daphnia magna]
MKEMRGRSFYRLLFDDGEGGPLAIERKKKWGVGRHMLREISGAGIWARESPRALNKNRGDPLPPTISRFRDIKKSDAV